MLFLLQNPDYSFDKFNKHGFKVFDISEDVENGKVSNTMTEYESKFRKLGMKVYALKEVHKQGLIHGDISTDNFIIMNNGAVKITDFASAKMAANELRENKADFLKPGYAAKEQYYANETLEIFLR